MTLAVYHGRKTTTQHTGGQLLPLPVCISERKEYFPMDQVFFFYKNGLPLRREANMKMQSELGMTETVTVLFIGTCTDTCTNNGEADAQAASLHLIMF